MGKIIQKSLIIAINLSFLFNPNLSAASSRGRSLTRPSMGTQLPKRTKSNDFILQFLDEQSKENDGADESERNFFEWIPDGSLISAVPPDCLPENFETYAQKAKMQATDFAKLTQDYFNRCGAYLSAKATGGLPGLVDYAMASYPFLENSQIHSQVFKTKDGRTLNGFIGIKDQAPRPWIIYKCGVFCAAEPDAVTLKNYMIHLFDQTPFNVIFLGNRTGQDYITTNKVFNFGGYFESQDFFDVAHWLRDESPYQNLVSSVHVVAVSLGGSAAYLTEKKISSTENQETDLIQSVTSLCAVSDLRPTVENMYADSLKGMIFSRVTWQMLQDVKPALKNVADLIGDEQPDSQDFPNLLGQLVSRFMVSPASNLEKEKEFWRKSNYSSSKHFSQIPLFIWASEDDSIVDFNINTGHLLELKGSSQKTDPNLGIVKVPFGEHCGFATAYGYPVTASVIKSFILNNSPEFLNKQKQTVIPIHISPPALLDGERIIGYWWSQDPKQTDSIKLKIEIYGADDSLCPAEWLFEGSANCIREAYLEFKNTFFDPYGFLKPHNLIEREVLIRELNARTSLNFNNKSIVGLSTWPNQILIHL